MYGDDMRTDELHGRLLWRMRRAEEELMRAREELAELFPRQSGRTTKLLRQAMLLAINGHKVQFVVAAEAMRTYVMGLMLDDERQEDLRQFIDNGRGHGRFERFFLGGGHLRVTFREVPGMKAIFDHYVPQRYSHG